MKSLQYLLFLCVIVGCVACNREEAISKKAGTVPTHTPTMVSEVKPVFDAALLAGKTPKEVENILGRRPTESWKPTDDLPSDRLPRWMQTYSIGKDMTIEYKANSVDSFVIFFAESEIKDSSSAYRLVGLDPTMPRPKGISQINAVENWIKVYYSR